jgi:hypothetical protein
MTYQEITKRIESLKKDLELATSQDEINYLELELMVAEDYLEVKIAKGRR